MKSILFCMAFTIFVELSECAAASSTRFNSIWLVFGGFCRPASIAVVPVMKLYGGGVSADLDNSTKLIFGVIYMSLFFLGNPRSMRGRRGDGQVGSAQQSSIKIKMGWG